MRWSTESGGALKEGSTSPSSNEDLEYVAGSYNVAVIGLAGSKLLATQYTINEHN